MTCALRTTVPLFLLGPLAVLSCSSDPGSEADPLGQAQQELTQTLRQPFAQTSYICQSYRGYSHASGYSLDIGVTPASCNAGNDDSGGKAVVAPAAGTVTKLPTTGLNAYLCIQLDGGGAVSLGHVKAISGIAVGTKVTKGQQVATVAHSWDTASGNGGIAHLHFDAFDGTGCYNGNNKPFTGAFKLDCAPDLPFNATYGHYNGTKLTPCTGGSGGTGGTGGATCVKAAVSGAETELFKDLPPGSFGKAEAEALYNANITVGCSSSPLLYCPDCTLTRLQAVKMLVKAAKISTVNPPATATFSDVPTSDPDYAVVEAAAAAGITSGCGGGKFCPDDATTRGQLSTFVVRTLGWPLVKPSTPTYSDVPASHTHFAGIETVTEHCVSSGCGSGKFCPSDVATRATGAIFIARAFDLEGLNPCDPPAGTGGAASGGSSGSGAAAGSAGASSGGSAGTSSAGGPGSGGSWVGAGGVGGASGGAGSQATAGGGSAEPDEASGCGCVVGRRVPPGPTALIGALLVALALRRAREP